MKAPKKNGPQAAKKRQAPKTSRVFKRAIWGLVLGVCLVSGVWSLRFRQAQPPVVPLTTVDPMLAGIITTARVAVASAPKSADAWGKLGQALHAAEFQTEAQACYSNAAVLDRGNFRWPYLLGLLELQNQPEMAIQHLARATSLAEGKTDAPGFQLARAWVERGNFEEAAPYLRTLLAANPNHAAAHIELARVYLSRHAFKEATLELQPAMTNAYTLRPALLLAAQIAQRNGQPDTATQLSRRAASLPRPFDWPDPVMREVQTLRMDRARLTEQANNLIQQQHTKEAGEVLAKLLGTFPDDAEGLLLMGRLLYVERHCPEAETFLRRHLAVQTNSLNGLIQLGLSLLCQQRWNDAITTLETAVALKPDFAQAHSNLAVARSKIGDTAGAIRSYRNALRCTPGDVNIHIALAQELANAGQVVEAREHVIRATELNPNDPRLPAAREQLGLKP